MCLGLSFPLMLNPFTLLVGDTFKRTFPPTWNSRGLLTWSTYLFYIRCATFICCWIIQIFPTICWIIATPIMSTSSKSLQYNGILHLLLHCASNGANLMWHHSYCHMRTLQRPNSLHISLTSLEFMPLAHLLEFGWHFLFIHQSRDDRNYWNLV